MKAALKNADGTFHIAEVERPTLPASDYVLARVRVAGICGTDLRHWKQHEPELECHIMGHELAGEVVEVGPDVFNVKPGDRVVIETVMGRQRTFAFDAVTRLSNLSGKMAVFCQFFHLW
jgi:L-iditol 2-dehydrogenase